MYAIILSLGRHARLGLHFTMLEIKTWWLFPLAFASSVVDAKGYDLQQGPEPNSGEPYALCTFCILRIDGRLQVASRVHRGTSHVSFPDRYLRQLRFELILLDI